MGEMAFAALRFKSRRKIFLEKDFEGFRGKSRKTLHRDV
jgi:hypothetical protein